MASKKSKLNQELFQVFGSDSNVSETKAQKLANVCELQASIYTRNLPRKTHVCSIMARVVLKLFKDSSYGIYRDAGKRHSDTAILRSTFAEIQMKLNAVIPSMSESKQRLKLECVREILETMAIDEVRDQ